VRDDLEYVIDHWQLFDDDVLERNQADCMEILQAIQNLRATKESDVGRRLIDGSPFLALDAMEKDCSNFLENAGTMRIRNGRRDLLIRVLLIIWEQHGGKVRTSTTNRVPSGPLVRFLIAVTSSLGINLSPDTARNLVRKHRKAAN
jgi:hypothetical protein